MGGGAGDVHDGEALDVRLADLGGMGFQAGDLVVQDGVDVHEHAGGEILAGGAFVKQDVARVAGGGDGGGGQVAVILVGVVVIVHEDEIRVDLADDALQALDQRPVQGDGGVRVASPEHLGSPKDARRDLLLPAAGGEIRR